MRNARIVTEPVTLSPEAIQSLVKQVNVARHELNNALSLISAATELMRMNPEMVPKLIGTLHDQPQRISNCFQTLTNDVEKSLGLRNAAPVTKLGPVSS